MFDLVAESSDRHQRWKNHLQSGQSYTLGRDEKSDLCTAWDPHISREHVRVTPNKEVVEIEKLAAATNPIFYGGEQVAHCRVRGGEQFVIGSTTFHVVWLPAEPASPGTRPVEEVTFNRQDLEKVRFRDADKRIEVLTRLPAVIWGSRSESDLYHRLVNLFLAGVPAAEAVAVVKLDREQSAEILHWDRRQETAGEFRPSSRLVADALKKRKNTILHVWEPSNPSGPDYTAVAEFDWAFCTPIPEPAVDAWGIYVAGSQQRAFQTDNVPRAGRVDLQVDVKFTELVAEIIGAVRRLNRLERQQAGLRQFFAPPILSALGEDLDTELLVPRECDVTVMFCDLRGFSHQAEIAEHDLIGLLDRVSKALGVMTQQILKHGGVTGDFQGDAALGFWGWPFASEEAKLDACRAALGIRQAFTLAQRTPGSPLADFQMGIGIAHGRAVAGKIGTEDQVKITVFGPVVNLASRLEGMTAQLRAAILLDEVTAQAVSQRMDPSEGRVRKLAKVLPYGMEKPALVNELLPPESEWPELTDEHLRRYERGVDHFIRGEWDDAYTCLHGMPANDRAQDFLAMLIAQHNRTAPADWDGIIRLSNK